MGSGKGLAPPVTLSAHKRSSSLLSPSDSTASLNSEVSVSPLATSPIPDHVQDISSRVSLDQNNGNGAGSVAAAASKLECPICLEEMVCLVTQILWAVLIWYR